MGWVRWEFRVSSTPGVAAFNPAASMREERVLQGLRLRIGTTLANVFFSAVFKAEICIGKYDVMRNERSEADKRVIPRTCPLLLNTILVETSSSI